MKNSANPNWEQIFPAQRKTSDEELLETKNVMRKKKSHPVTDQFSNEESEECTLRLAVTGDPEP